MRSHRHLFEQITSEDNLERALEAAVKRRRCNPICATWLFQRRRRLRDLHARLLSRTWAPPGHRVLFLRDPKPRLITVATLEERVVHHALCGVLEPLWSRAYTGDTYACIIGRGAHRAVLHHQGLMRRHRFLLQLDIRKYFPSIPHMRLLNTLLARFPGEDLRWLCETIVRGHDKVWLRPDVQQHLNDPAFVPEEGRGLPIGLLTSQVWGNAYLSGLDHFIKRELKVPGYLRYMDDLTLFSDSRAALRQWEKQVRDWLERERGLSLRTERTRLLPCTATVSYLGQRVNRLSHVPGEPTRYKLEHRLHRWVIERPSWEHIERSLASVAGLW